ncbi:hypothetical protein [Clavibacter michiganensis]|uniref:hypothetical protein n=1 Tax=Clavibacter michiganensis TaxID=28447 RepID=UPI003EBF1A11
MGAPLAFLDLAGRRTSYEDAGLQAFHPAMLLSIYTPMRHGFLADTSGHRPMLIGRAPADAVQVVAAAAHEVRSR